MDFTGGLHIAFSGLIAAGKTTIATALGQALKLPVYFESVVENDLLNNFYRDPKEYGFVLQVHLLNQRFAQQQQLIWGHKGGIQDRSIYEDTIFARMLNDTGMMTDIEYSVYMRLFNNMTAFACKPNLIIHLDLSPEESLRRLRERNRGMEATVTLDYLQSLHDGYQLFLTEISKTTPVIKLNWETYKDVDEVVALIKAEYEKISTIHQIE